MANLNLYQNIEKSLYVMVERYSRMEYFTSIMVGHQILAWYDEQEIFMW